MIKTISSDKIIGLGILVLSLVLYFIIIPRECDSHSAEGSIGPDFFPKVTSILLGILSLGLFFQKKIDAPKEIKRNTLQVIVTGAIIFLYVFMTEYIGYITSTVLVLIFFLTYYGCKNKLIVVAVTILVTGGVYLFFSGIMQVVLPRGCLI